VTDADDEVVGFGFETRAIHAGQEPDATTGAVVVPVFQTSTFAQDGVGRPREGWEYSRSGNPTRAALETALADLEGGATGLAMASGLAATDTLVRSVCQPGDHVVIPHDAYGGTFRLFARVLERWGLQWTAVDLADLDALTTALERPTRLVWCETPTNPLLHVADITAVAAVAHDAGAFLAVDNTFATPYLQRPLALGADVVVHSTTKYLGGHSDVVGGALVAADEDVAEELAYHQNAMGAIAGPFDSWLVSRSLRRWSTCSRATRGWERSSTRASPRTPATRWPGARCAASAGWCRSEWPAAPRRRSASASRPGCSRSPSRSVASSR
jgi:cystathionine gamma-synthase